MEKSCKWFLRTRFNNNLIILTTSFKSSEDILICLHKKHEATGFLNFHLRRVLMCLNLFSYFKEDQKLRVG